jgi:hypothetical protein
MLLKEISTIKKQAMKTKFLSSHRYALYVLEFSISVRIKNRPAINQEEINLLKIKEARYWIRVERLKGIFLPYQKREGH